MKIRPHFRNESSSEDPPKDFGPFWWVSEGDRHVTHQITLAEVLGLHEPEGGVDQHRRVATNHLRNAIFDTLRDGMPAEAITSGDYSAFSRNFVVARQSLAALCERPSFDWPANVSPFTLSLSALINCFRDGKQRLAGKRDDHDRWWAIVISKLDEALAIAEARLVESAPQQDDSAAWRTVGVSTGSLPSIHVDG